MESYSREKLRDDFSKDHRRRNLFDHAKRLKSQAVFSCYNDMTALSQLLLNVPAGILFAV